jgi:hypothetical protein
MTELIQDLELLNNLRGMLELLIENSPNKVKQEAFTVLHNDVVALTQQLLDENVAGA